jgi:FAD/FMN-containing dehydrogenase
MKWLFSRETLNLFRRLKNAFDPENLCNPDKLIPLVSKAAAPPSAPDSSPSLRPATSDGVAVPTSEEELIGCVRAWVAEKTRFGIQGRQTKYQVSEKSVIQTTHLNRVLDFDKGNLTLTVQGGAWLSDVRAQVEGDGQYLWMAGEGTVGGVIATRSSVVPPLRDLILGMRILLPNGEIVQLGAKTMKNVAGYDAAKLMIGSWGTLGIILDVILRLFPYPPAALQAAEGRPFVFNDLHRRIKSAFDPLGLLMPKFFELTATEIAAHPKGTPRDPDFKRFEDKLWM